MENFVLKGNICYSQTLSHMTIVEQGYLVCHAGRSAGVYSELPLEYQNLPVTDYGNRMIIPGLVDLHIHAPQYAFRGTGMDLELMEWLEQVTFPEEEKYEDLDYARRAYTIFATQLQRGATTRASIFATRHVPATELLMELMDQTGLYTYVGKVNMDRGAPNKLLDASASVSASLTIDWVKGALERYHRTKPVLTPRFIPCCSDRLLQKLGEVQQMFQLPVQSHLSENPGEVQLVRQLRPDIQFYGEGYDVYNLFGYHHSEQRRVPVIMAHCVYSTEEEIQRILEHGVYVAHCPSSNVNLASGIAPIRKYLEQGVRVGLGTDVAGGHSDSIFHAMVDAIGVSKLYWRLVDSAYKPLTFDEAFYLGTKGGGAFFGQAGSFETGYLFDAVVLDDRKLPYPGHLSVRERLERFAYLDGDRNGIVAKYAGGQLVKLESEYV